MYVADEETSCKLLRNSNKQIYTQNNTFITAIDPFHRTIYVHIKLGI